MPIYHLFFVHWKAPRCRGDAVLVDLWLLTELLMLDSIIGHVSFVNRKLMFIDAGVWMLDAGYDCYLFFDRIYVYDISPLEFQAVRMS